MWVKNQIRNRQSPVDLDNEQSLKSKEFPDLGVNECHSLKPCQQYMLHRKDHFNHRQTIQNPHTIHIEIHIKTRYKPYTIHIESIEHPYKHNLQSI